MTMSATGPDLPQQIEDEGANRRVRIFSGRHRPPHLCYCAPGPPHLVRLAAIRNPARACRLQEADAAAAAESPTGWLAIVGFFVWLSIWAGETEKEKKAKKKANEDKEGNKV
ncbi:hypothetical protein N7533_013405 [Penicillium manginii]|uniref:uncharacterized protein n=1 Tax=Penicillium manginii TaxID=203109 RepID=UPI0025484662|nr:uncharacterized protein N7533_013405 [Penicillium manginii]KAJ5732958.1 hypothetical protein N7533_013405 [Penicillium manginii]